MLYKNEKYESKCMFRHLAAVPENYIEKETKIKNLFKKSSCENGLNDMISQKKPEKFLDKVIRIFVS